MLKVIDFGNNRKRVCHFRSGISSNIGRVLQRLGNTAT